MCANLTLTLASFVLHHKSPPYVAERLAVLISDFLVVNMTLTRACEVSHQNSSLLLEMMWNRSFLHCKRDQWTVLKLLHSNSDYHEKAFSQALAQSTKRGDLTMTRWLLSHIPDNIIGENVVEEAAKSGNLEILQLLETRGNILFGHKSLDNAAKIGRWDLVHWLNDRIVPGEWGRISTSVMGLEALKQNNVEELKWVLANHFSMWNVLPNRCIGEEWRLRKEILLLMLEKEYITLATVLQFAAENGDLALLQWGLSCGTEKTPAQAMFAAAASGRLDVVKYLYEKYSEDFTSVLFHEGQVVLPQIIEHNNLFRPSTTMDAVARNGHLEMLQFLHQINIESKLKMEKQPDYYPQCTVVAMDIAAACGHLKIVQWLHYHRSEGCTTRAMDLAATRRFHAASCYGSSSDNCCLDRTPNSFKEIQLAIVQWLQENRSEGCTALALDGAAANGDFIMLKWLHENTSMNCTHRAMDGAASLGRLDIVKWLHINRTEGCSTVAMDQAAAGGHLEVLKWLNDNRTEGCTTKAMDSAATGGHLEVVKWLNMNRSEGSTAVAMNGAAANGYLRMVQWLNSFTHTFNLSSAMKRAEKNSHFEVELFLQSQSDKESRDI